MSANKKLLGIGLVLTTFATVTAIAVSGSSMHQLNSSLFKADAVVNVSTTYSLLLDESWGYNGEATKVKTSTRDNDFTIGFSNSGSDFSGAATGKAFSTTTDGAYIYTVSLLNGISQVYVKGSSTNEKSGVTVYAHYIKQTECVDDGETVNGTLNSLISFAPTNYVAIKFEGTDNIESVEIGYSCLEANAPFGYMMSGGQNTDGNGLFQSMAGISTTLPVGTNVHITMDVAVTGTFDSASCEVYWVNDVYTSSGGESDKSRTSIKSVVVNGDVGWHTIEFDATVRNFPNLRYNTKYETQDTSEFGNAIYLIAVTHASLDSFNYKNVVIQEVSTLIYGCANKTGNGFHQSATGLSTELAVGTAVEISMDVLVTGSFNEYSSIYVVDSVWSADSGYRNATTNIKSTIVTGDAGWHNVTFTATVRNFAKLGNNSNYETSIDTSSFGNAIYILTENNSSATFNYKNVIIQQIIAAPAAQKNSNNNYYSSYIGFTANGFAEGADVHVSLDMYYTGGTDAYTVVYALDKSVINWGGGDYADGLHNIKVIEAGGSFPTTGFATIEFDTKVYSHSSAIHWGANGATFDVSTYGVCVLLCFNNTTNATSPAMFRNVVITAA